MSSMYTPLYNDNSNGGAMKAPTPSLNAPKSLNTEPMAKQPKPIPNVQPPAPQPRQPLAPPQSPVTPPKPPIRSPTGYTPSAGIQGLRSMLPMLGNSNVSKAVGIGGMPMLMGLANAAGGHNSINTIFGQKSVGRPVSVQPKASPWIPSTDTSQAQAPEQPVGNWVPSTDAGQAPPPPTPTTTLAPAPTTTPQNEPSTAALAGDAAANFVSGLNPGGLPTALQSAVGMTPHGGLNAAVAGGVLPFAPAGVQNALSQPLSMTGASWPTATGKLLGNLKAVGKGSLAGYGMHATGQGIKDLYDVGTGKVDLRDQTNQQLQQGYGSNVLENLNHPGIAAANLRENLRGDRSRGEKAIGREMLDNRARSQELDKQVKNLQNTRTDQISQRMADGTATRGDLADMKNRLNEERTQIDNSFGGTLDRTLSWLGL